jgi:hypothetical protein
VARALGVCQARGGPKRARVTEQLVAVSAALGALPIVVDEREKAVRHARRG